MEEEATAVVAQEVVVTVGEVKVAVEEVEETAAVAVMAVDAQVEATAASAVVSHRAVSRLQTSGCGPHT